MRVAALAVGVIAVGGAITAILHVSGSPSRHPPQAVHLALPPPPRPAPARALAAVPTPAAPTPVPETRAAEPRPAEPAPPAKMSAPMAVTPAPSRGDTPAWRRFAVSAPAAGGRPLIAVVIDDMGVDRKHSARAAALPAPLTLSWLPYAAEVGPQAEAARAAGHEILLHAPMQPQGHENPGPNALLVDLSGDEIRRRLIVDLGVLPQAVGLNNHMGSLFTRSPRAMAPVIEELKQRGLLFLDSRTSGGTIAAELAREAGVPYAERDVFLDNEATVEAVRARLAEVETIALRRGAAVAIGHPHEATLDALEPWLRTLAARGFVQVPISAIVQYRLDHPPPQAARG
jgi:uncharacterized protein